MCIDKLEFTVDIPRLADGYASSNLVILPGDRLRPLDLGSSFLL
jgi:hypothetical protein